MTLKRTLIASAACLAAALPVAAEEAYRWPICDELAPLIAAGDEETPFMSLSEQTRAGQSMGTQPGRASLGMEPSHKCRVYIAGDPEGYVGGGPWNYFSCQPYWTSGDDVVAPSAMVAERQRIAGMLGTCPQLADWRYTAPENPDGPRADEMWTKEGSDTQIVVASERQGSRQEVTFYVRAPNPSYTPPKPVE